MPWRRQVWLKASRQLQGRELPGTRQKRVPQPKQGDEMQQENDTHFPNDAFAD